MNACSYAIAGVLAAALAVAACGETPATEESSVSVNSDQLARASVPRIGDLPRGTVLQQGAAVATLGICGARRYFWNAAEGRASAPIGVLESTTMHIVVGVFDSEHSASAVFSRLHGSAMLRCYQRRIRHRVVVRSGGNQVGAAQLSTRPVRGMSAKTRAYGMRMLVDALIPTVVTVELAFVQVDRRVWALSLSGVGEPPHELLEHVVGVLVKRARTSLAN